MINTLNLSTFLKTFLLNSTCQINLCVAYDVQLQNFWKDLWFFNPIMTLAYLSSLVSVTSKSSCLFTTSSNVLSLDHLPFDRWSIRFVTLKMKATWLMSYCCQHECRHISDDHITPAQNIRSSKCQELSILA